MTLWMLRRLLKFCLKKYIGPYVKGELDLDQFDFQLYSSGLHDIALNVEEINAKISEYPIQLKEGSIGRVTITLLPRLNIQLDGVELRFIPRKGRTEENPKSALPESTSEAQQLEASRESEGPNSVGAYSYSPVQEGVRVVANLFERLFFGVHVTVSQVFIAIEEMGISTQSENNSSLPQCLLLFRVGLAEYKASRSTSIERGKRLAGEFSSFTSDISFQRMYVELVDIHGDGCEDLTSVAGDGKAYGKPVSITKDGEGLSGHVKVGICTKAGSFDMPKVDADIDLEHVRLNFTAQQIQQILRLISSYFTADKHNVETSQLVDSNNNVGLSSNDLFFSKETSDIVPTKEAPFCKPAMVNSQGRYSGSSLPGAQLIVDWVHWSGGEKNADAAGMSEEEFVASTEEFFDCLSGSGLWVWTCSALSAISAASSLTSGSVLLSQEFGKQVTYAIKAKITALSVVLHEGQNKDHYMEIIIVGIDFSQQVSQQRSKWQLLLKRIEGFECENQDRQDTNYEFKQDNSICPEVVRSSPQPLQALVEKSVPNFPISLCERSWTEKDCEIRKKCFLRVVDHGHLSGVQVDAKNNCVQRPGAEATLETQDVTEISFSLQPIVVWMDASIVRILHTWADSFHLPADIKETTMSSDLGSSFPSTKKLRVNLYSPKIRFWICSPCSSGPLLLKDHLLCIDLSCPFEKVRRPMVKLRLSGSGNSRNLCVGSATVSLQGSNIYLVSPSLCTSNIKIMEKALTLDFYASKVLSISAELATVEVLFNRKSGGGIFLAERTWMGVTEQQKGGTGGRKSSSEFAAATATEVMDENNRQIREDILQLSPICLLVAIPKLEIELLASQQCLVAEIILAILDIYSSLQVSKRECLVDKDTSQLSISLDVGEADIILHSVPEISSTTDNPWEKYIINIDKLQMLHVVNLGTVKDATYFWLRHGNGSVRGLLADNPSGDLLQLLTCKDNVLGRGDGGGGNALATKSAGIEVSVISWRGGNHAEDMLITIALGGCTFMAHGGRLDWLPGLITAFGQKVHRDSFKHAILERRILSGFETSIVHLDVTAIRTGEEALPTKNYVIFTLDLHDAALCYEPGKEAVSAANLRSTSTAENFDPVACLIAAAAVRVSSNAISSTANKDYEIWLRDVALLLADTTRRKNSALNYAPESLQQAGYIKVAGEAVMEAVVHINVANDLEWWVECANNQLRLDTCHDTTAALGRLIAQLQQLFAPEVEHPITDKSAKNDLGSSSIEESSEQPLYNVGTEMSLPNSKNATLLEEFLEDAFMFVRDCPVHPVCDHLDAESKNCDDMLWESVQSLSDQCSMDCEEVEDLRTPVAESEEAPPFIEDYYISKKSSLQSSSRSSGCQDNGVLLQNLQDPSNDFDMLSTADGSGGWYDGPTFKVVENHMPPGNGELGFNNHTDTSLHSSKQRPAGLALNYPQSVGRVVFRDLNFRWRLYGGSDWPIHKTKCPVSSSHQCTSGRQIGQCLEVIFHGVDLQYDTFPETGVYASRLGLSIQDVCIYDCSKDAPWKKILGYHRSKSRPRESSAKALNLELESVRPDPMFPLEEYRLFLKLLPLRLHLDQRHIDFFTKFFPASTSSSQQPHSGYEEVSSSYSSFETRVTEGFEEVLVPFFQVFELQPFTIRVDYIPRRVDINALRSGNYAELANLVSWKGIELELKHVKATGVHGWGTLSGIVVGEWLEDISHNQIHKLLKGLGPMRPLFAVGSGAAKLVVLPAEHYKRDRRRLLRGVRKGATAFLRSISLEAVGLGVQLAAGAHEILVQTESALGSTGLVSSLEVKVRTKAGQPGDVREGLQQACERLSQGLERTASSLISNPWKAYHMAGTSMAVASALRAAPAAAVAPAAAAADALHRALLGVRNSLDPERRRESEEKYSGPPPE